MAVDLNVVAEDMYAMVLDAKGTKKFKPGDLFKAMVKKYGDDGFTKKDAKGALKIHIDSGKLVYSYFNGTFVEIPGVEAAAKALED